MTAQLSHSNNELGCNVQPDLPTKPSRSTLDTFLKRIKALNATRKGYSVSLCICICIQFSHIIIGIIIGINVHMHMQ